MTVNERTPLCKPGLEQGRTPPPYVFMTNPNRVYRKQVRQFQCFICFLVLTTFTTALVITVIYSVDHDTEDLEPLPQPGDNASLQKLLSLSWPLQDNGVPVWQGPEPKDSELNDAISTGRLSLEARDAIETQMEGLPVSSPSYRHQQSIKTSAQATDLARSGYVMNVATLTFIKVKKKLMSSANKTVGRGKQLGLKWLPLKECGQGPLPPCPASSYRSIDGTCNNLYKPTQWGVAMRPFRRQLAPDYADGVLSPRVASDGNALPSARNVSVTVHPAKRRDDAKFTVMLAVWGQFMDHDITSTALSIGKGGKPISCCGTKSTTDIHPECYPVYVPEEDNYYKAKSISCIEFVRSAAAPTCALGPREQLNQVSSFLDASVVYGNTQQLSQSLRTFQGGQLKMLNTPNGRTLLPISTNPDDGCNTEEENAKGRYCFMSGDARANENLHLTTLHLLMARQHNQLAQKLSVLNPDWNDEKLYQESRKIVSAQMQHITYNEFLPVILGNEITEKLELNPKINGYYNGYNSSLDSTVSNNFATASFRFAHSLLPGLIKMLSNDTSSDEYIELHKMLFNPYSLYNTGQLDRSVNSAINTNLERADTFFNKQVTQHLFEKAGKNPKTKTPTYGLDLVALNIQRGRDHGLPSYPNWREFCGLSRPKTFDDLTDFVDQDSLNSLKSIYKNVSDIDMYSGALSELPVQGGMLGPTLTCLISDQFVRLKQGDRFWYENPFSPQAFTPGQLNEIRKTSLAKIICDTSDNATMAQPFVMQNVGPGNTRVPCSNLPSLDLTEWLSPNEEKVAKPYARIGLTVTGGSVQTDDGTTLWTGETPIAISLPLLDSVLSDKLAFPASPVYYGHGIQWTGTLTVRLNEINIEGIFSLPKYVHAIPDVSNFTTKWINGNFKFTSKLLWNNSEVDSLKLDQTYSSPIFLSEQTIHSSEITNKQFVIVHTEKETPKVIGTIKLPVILKGSFSPDRKLFYWSGNVTATMPKQNVTETEQLKSPLDSDKNKMVGGFSVVDGTVTSTSSDGHVMTIWSGNPPVALSLPNLYTIISQSNTLVYGSGIMWLSSISDYKIEGSFSFPQFGNLTIEWLNGEFKFNLIPLWNVTVQNLLTPGIKYSSKFILKEGKLVESLQLLNTFDNFSDSSKSLKSFIVDSQDVLDGIVPAPLILFGNFSPDKSTFYWSGDIIIAVHRSKEKLKQQFTLLTNAEPSYGPWPSNYFGGTVIRGELTTSVNNASDSIIWDGIVPVSIPMPTFWSPISDTPDGKEFIFSKGILWSGTLLGTTLKGEYRLPQIIWNGTAQSVQVWKGKFIFEITPMWNTTLKNILVSGAKYYSKINFEGTKTIETSDEFNDIYGDEINSALLAPLILQGTYSLDKKMFFWSGNFIISFKNGPVLAFNLPKPQPRPVIRNILGKDKGEIKTSVTVSFTSGQIWASPIGENFTNIWNGEFPVTVPLTSIISPQSYDLIGDLIWTGQVLGNKFEGIFSMPTYTQNGSTTNTIWWSGNFSFVYTTKWDASLEDLVTPGKKYNFQILFQPQLKSSSLGEKTNKNTLIQFVADSQEILENAGKGKIILLGDFYSKPFYCYVLPCSDKNEFYWSGEAFFTVITPIIKEIQPSDLNNDFIKYNQQFGAQVAGGYIKAGLDDRPMNTWWTGGLPVTIPLPVFWSPADMLISSDVISNGVIWSGSLYGSLFQGTFSLPQYGWNGISTSVQWWNGQFLFILEPLWNFPVNGLVIPGVKYYSRIHFHDSKYHNLSVITNTPSQDEVDTATLAPIVLQGTYSPDGTTFLWDGKFLISFKNLLTELKFLGSKTPSDKSNVKETPEIPSSGPKKSSISLTIIGGNVFAMNESGNTTKIWAGKFPTAIDLSLFIQEGSYYPTAVANMTIETLKPNLEGTFSIPTHVNNKTTSTELWSGNFTLAYATKWNASLMSIINERKLYSCKVVFREFKNKLNKMIDEIDNPIFNIGEKLKANIFNTDKKKELSCKLILIGNYETQAFYCGLAPFLCSPSNVFYWSGDAILSIPQPVPTTVYSTNTNLKSTGMIQRKFGATVISGNIIGNIENRYPSTLWSNQLPVAIPLPVFWTSAITEPSSEPNVYGHGVIWSGTQIGSLIQGSFSLPQYTGHGIFSSIQWWTGQFSFLLEPSWNLTLDDLIIPGVTYNSRIILRDAEINYLQSPDQDGIDSALHVPIVLLGKYSLDRKIFYWTGRVIIAFREIPNPYFNYLGNIKSTNLIGKTDISKKVKPQNNVGIIALSGNVTVQAGNSTSLWSGNLPVSIPLDSLNKTTKISAVNVIWSAVINGSQIEGNFSLPKILPDDDNFTVEWFSGSFNFKFITLWNTSFDRIKPGTKYSCWLIFKNSSKMINSPEHDSLQQLIMDSEEVDGTETCTIMLSGTLSPDTQSFTWSGQAWINFKMNKTNNTLTLNHALSDENLGVLSYKKFGGAVYDGEISSNGEILWSGNIPVSITLPLPFWVKNSDPLGVTSDPLGHGIIWSGSVFGSNLKGSFSFPQYTWNGFIKQITWIQGEFSLNIKPLWNSSLSDIIQPSVKYYSSIHFQGLKDNKTVTTDLENIHLSAQNEINLTQEKTKGEFNLTQIILQGEFSPDKTLFYWSGNFILSVNSPTIAL